MCGGWSDDSERRRAASAGAAATARPVRPSRDGRLPGRLAASARHPGPHRAARRDLARRSGTWPQAAGGREAAHGEPGGRSGVLLALDAHPLLREYFARQLREQQPEAWRAAHRRLYEHLCATTPESPSPRSKTSNRSTKPWPTAARRGCSRRRMTRFTRPHPARGRGLQPEETRRVRFRLGSRRLLLRAPRGAASRPRSRKPTKPGC